MLSQSAAGLFMYEFFVGSTRERVELSAYVSVSAVRNVRFSEKLECSVFL